MTVDSKRLDELHAATEPVGEYEWERAIDNAWPAISAELTRLREFARRVREAGRFRDDTSVAGTVLHSINWLDDEIKKGGA